MLCLSGFELYSRWVPLTCPLESLHASIYKLLQETKGINTQKKKNGNLLAIAHLKVELVF